MAEKLNIQKREEVFQDLCKKFRREYSKEYIDKLREVYDDLYEATVDERVTENETKFEHILNIAAICVDEIGLGYTSVLCVMLFELNKYKVVDANSVDIYKNEGVDLILSGLEKISRFSPQSPSNQAESFRSLLLNLAVDVRVILVKIAERLHTMRILKFLDKDFQFKASHEAFYLYAPLAHRLGLYKVKSEMEDLALKYTNPDAYFDIAKRLNETAASRNKFISEFIDPIKRRLTAEGLKFEIKGRPKSIHSIWNKMRKSKVTFDDVYDKFAIRIILDSAPEQEKSDCWKVYSIVTENYQPNPKRLRDWISIPKSNGYESLHTTVVVTGGKWVEVQIRTVRMDEIAEKGFAAHWKYKEGKQGGGIDDWLGKVREMMEFPEPDARDFIDDFKLSLYSKEIFVFTPMGELRKFPEGATILDFAYEIHTDLGKQCSGGKINGKNVSIRHAMQNGDKIEVITSKNQKPSIDWLNYVVTSKAKSKIKQGLNEAKIKDAEIGKDLVKRRFKNWKINYSDTNINIVLKHFKLKNALDFYYLLANEKLDIANVKELLTRHDEVAEKPLEVENKLTAKEAKPSVQGGQNDFLLIDEKLVGVDYKLSKCCNPIFGDNIFGFVTVGSGIKIHRTNCPNAMQLYERYAYRIVPAKWKMPDKDLSFIAGIRITGNNELGMFNKISELITQELKAVIRTINMDSKEDTFDGEIKVAVKDKNQLDGLLVRLNQLSGVHRAVRTGN